MKVVVLVVLGLILAVRLRYSPSLQVTRNRDLLLWYTRRTNKARWRDYIYLGKIW